MRRSWLMSRWLLIPVGVVWSAAVAFGWARVLDYTFRPGDAGTPSRSWPADPPSPHRVAALRGDGRCARLVMVAHPHCPCTRASIAELAHVLARARGSVVATVLFYRPRQASQGWERTDLWRSAAAIPGVTVLADPDGREARRLGVVTSGHVLVYDRTGKRLFTGGITGSRGHAGHNVGRDSVIQLLTRGVAARRHSFVYGCSIRTAQVESGP